MVGPKIYLFDFNFCYKLVYILRFKPWVSPLVDLSDFM